jgi:hypothetical protein
MAEATPPPPHEHDARRELRDVLEMVLKRITGQVWSNPRQTQLDAGRAIGLLYDVEVRNGDYLGSTLSALVRELGGRYADTSRYVPVLESFIAELDRPAVDDEPPWDTDEDEDEVSGAEGS